VRARIRRHQTLLSTTGDQRAFHREDGEVGEAAGFVFPYAEVSEAAREIEAPDGEELSAGSPQDPHRLPIFGHLSGRMTSLGENSTAPS
jgi:hypothetical protein